MMFTLYLIGTTTPPIQKDSDRKTSNNCIIAKINTRN